MRQPEADLTLKRPIIPLSVCRVVSACVFFLIILQFLIAFSRGLNLPLL